MDKTNIVWTLDKLVPMASLSTCHLQFVAVNGSLVKILLHLNGVSACMWCVVFILGMPHAGLFDLNHFVFKKNMIFFNPGPMPVVDNTDPTEQFLHKARPGLCCCRVWS